MPQLRVLVLSVVGNAVLLVPPAGAQTPTRSAAPSPPPPAPEEIRRRVEAYVQPFVEDGHLSASILLARGGDVVYERSAPGVRVKAGRA